MSRSWSSGDCGKPLCDSHELRYLPASGCREFGKALLVVLVHQGEKFDALREGFNPFIYGHVEPAGLV